MTSILTVLPHQDATDQSSQAAIHQAATILRHGQLVAIPTETVYGLAAHALDESAVRRIFQAKGRPAFNPLIVHVQDAKQAQTLVTQWTREAQLLTDRFWPGPLTIILPRSPQMVPDIVTAGGPTVALRAPNHPVARLLLERTGFPLAAPSANRSEEISPTTAQHVLQSLGSQIELILDAGPTLHGIESTVIDLTDTPRILRPGPISSHQIEQIIGPLAPPVLLATITDIRSPGQLSRHYAPKTKLILTDTPLAIIRSMTQSCQRIVWIALEGETTSKDAVVITLPNDPAGYRHHLYAALHQADQAAGDLIIVTRPPIGPDWDAIHDRLQRAASSIS